MKILTVHNTVIKWIAGLDDKFGDGFDHICLTTYKLCGVAPQFQQFAVEKIQKYFELKAEAMDMSRISDNVYARAALDEFVKQWKVDLTNNLQAYKSDLVKQITSQVNATEQ